MGSLAENNGLNLKDGGNNPVEEVAPKPDHHPHHHNLQNPEGSCSSSVSTPEPDAEVVVQHDASQRQKRKGGRKPIYATSEERKQRNRQAQAAFRERRTEYIKQLENTIKLNEETLQTLQQSHRNAADECLMLRYKNSLLERILLEKGIDVQAELRLKSGSPIVPPAKMASQVTHPSPLAQSPITRQPSNRVPAGIAPKLEPGRLTQAPREGAYSMHSPQLQPTPASHVSSPATAKSPGFPLQPAMSPTTPEMHSQPQNHHTFGPYRPSILPQPGGNFVPGPCVMTPSSTADTVDPNMPSRSGASASGSPLNSNNNNNGSNNLSNNNNHQSRAPGAYYHLSPFQKQYEHLDREYDVQGELADQPAPDASSEANVYQGYRSQSLARGDPPRNDHSALSPQSTEPGSLGQSNAFLDHFDPMLDADPFGLTASMHFQTPFSYNQHQTRS